MSFIEQRLLECVTYGTSGGPTWSTRKIALRSGKVRRNPMRARPLYRFNLRYQNLQQAAHAEVIHAFNACFGGVHSFRLKDWQDFEAVDEQLSTTGTGSPQSLQLTKTYTFGSESVERTIRKPVSGTVSMTANGVPISSSIDYATGIATFTATVGHVIRWSGQFDVPVMFEQDDLPFVGDDRNADGLFLTADVPLVEDTDA